MRGRKPVSSERRKFRDEVYFTKDLHETLVELAKQRGVTKTYIIEEAFKEYLERHGVVVAQKPEGG